MISPPNSYTSGVAVGVVELANVIPIPAVPDVAAPKICDNERCIPFIYNL